MKIGLLTLTLYIPHAQSLKDRRRELRSIKDQLRNRLNVAVAEVGGSELWQRTELAITTVSGDAARVDETLTGALKLVERNPSVEALDPHFEVW